MLSKLWILFHCLDTKCTQWPLFPKFMDTRVSQCSQSAKLSNCSIFCKYLDTQILDGKMISLTDKLNNTLEINICLKCIQLFCFVLFVCSLVSNYTKKPYVIYLIYTTAWSPVYNSSLLSVSCTAEFRHDAHKHTHTQTRARTQVSTLPPADRIGLKNQCTAIENFKLLGTNFQAFMNPAEIFS